MPVRTARIGAYSGSQSGALQVIGQIPPLRTGIVKHVVLRHTAGGSPAVVVALRTAAGDIQVIRDARAAGVVHHWQGMDVVAEPGDQLLVQVAGGAPHLEVALFGALLDGPPQ